MKSRSVALAALLVLAATACGARLSDEQRTSILGSNRGGTAIANGPTGAGQTSPVSFERTGSDGLGADAVTGGSGTKGCVPTGPLTATDTGVSATEIRLGTVSDVSGVIPGLALSTFQAMQAAAAYINSQGGICGRRVVLDLRDDQTTANGNKASTQEACSQDFALVGSFSAFDDGGARTVGQMKCPDMSAFTTTAERGQSNPYTYPIYPNRPDYFVVSSAKYVARVHPDVISNAGIVWLNAGVAAVNARARIKGYESAGFRFVYEESAAVLETSYTPFVVSMKNHNPPVKFFTMVADSQSIVRMLQAMDQQDWYPKVMQFDLQVYTPQFLDLAQGTGEGALFWLNSAMFEEAAAYPEMQLYLEWLQRVTPGAEPDTFGLFAWSAGRLFQQLATQIGPNLTRAKLVAALNRTTAWTGHGLHPPMDVAHRLPAGCEVFGVIRNNRYVRQAPASGFDCGGGLVHLT